ncbi:hypothetical protein Q7P37_004410 [Cladosporium fusiforme]
MVILVYISLILQFGLCTRAIVARARPTSITGLHRHPPIASVVSGATPTSIANICRVGHATGTYHDASNARIPDSDQSTVTFVVISSTSSSQSSTSPTSTATEPSQHTSTSVGTETEAQALGSKIRTILFEILGLLLGLVTLVVAVLHLRAKNRAAIDVEASMAESHDLNDVEDALPSKQEDDNEGQKPDAGGGLSLPNDD